MTLATIDAIIASKGKPNPLMTMCKFENWLFRGYYTPYNEVFDVGNTTRKAIMKFEKTVSYRTCGCSGEWDNGNGALMRMLPLAFLSLPITDKLKVAREYAALTHSHELNLLACEFFVEVVDNLIRGVDDWLLSAYSLIQFYGDPTGAFARIPHIGKLTRNEIKSTGFVIDTLEAALWCFYTTNNYRDCVLKAVNLGGDTDTISAIAGGLAGLVYGEKDIPAEWLSQIARLDYIRDMLNKAEKTFDGSTSVQDGSRLKNQS
jgi:ADP-ribosylglycohydrolase